MHFVTPTTLRVDEMTLVVHPAEVAHTGVGDSRMGGLLMAGCTSKSTEKHPADHTTGRAKTARAIPVAGGEETHSVHLMRRGGRVDVRAEVEWLSQDRAARVKAREDPSACFSPQTIDSPALTLQPANLVRGDRLLALHGSGFDGFTDWRVSVDVSALPADRLQPPVFGRQDMGPRKDGFAAILVATNSEFGHVGQYPDMPRRLTEPLERGKHFNQKSSIGRYGRELQNSQVAGFASKVHGSGVVFGGVVRSLARGGQHLFERHLPAGQFSDGEHSARRHLVTPLRDSAHRNLEVSRDA